MKAAELLLIALIALGSAGCGHKDKAPVAMCAAPVKPELPLFVSELPFDHITNIEILLKRDDYMRQYAKGLEDTVHCYEEPIEVAK